MKIIITGILIFLIVPFMTYAISYWATTAYYSSKRRWKILNKEQDKREEKE